MTDDRRRLGKGIDGELGRTARRRHVSKFYDGAWFLRGNGGNGNAEQKPQRGDADPQGHRIPSVARTIREGWPMSRTAVGMPIRGGSRCLISLWQRAHSILCPAT